MISTKWFWDLQWKKFDRGEQEQLRLTTIERIKSHFDPDDVVLDFGCAAGRTSCGLASEARAIHGLDISGKMIAAAKRRATRCPIKPTWSPVLT